MPGARVTDSCEQRVLVLEIEPEPSGKGSRQWFLQLSHLPSLSHKHSPLVISTVSEKHVFMYHYTLLVNIYIEGLYFDFYKKATGTTL